MHTHTLISYAPTDSTHIHYPSIAEFFCLNGSLIPTLTILQAKQSLLKKKNPFFFLFLKDLNPIPSHLLELTNMCPPVHIHAAVGTQG